MFRKALTYDISAVSDVGGTPGHGSPAENDRNKSNDASCLPKGVMGGHALCVDMAWFNRGAVAGFGSRKRRIVLGNGVSAIMNRFTVCIILLFLCASEFG